MVLFGLPLTSRAQSTNGITVSPSSKELIIGPGLIEAKTVIEVRNTTPKDLTAQIRLVDIEAKDEFGTVSFSQINSPLSGYSLAKWMSLPGGLQIKLPKNQTTTVPITIRNDNELSPGGHYGAVIVSVSTDESNSPNGVNFKQEIASLLFVKKIGGETYGIQLESLTSESLPNIPQAINLKFKGTGNVHVVPRGYIEVTDPKGRLIAKGIINPESTLVMPDKFRQFITILQPVEEAKLKGEYKITAYYRYDGNEEFQLKTVTFKRGISNVFTGIILLVLLFITGVVIVLVKRLKIIKRWR